MKPTPILNDALDPSNSLGGSLLIEESVGCTVRKIPSDPSGIFFSVSWLSHILFLKQQRPIVQALLILAHLQLLLVFKEILLKLFFIFCFSKTKH